jgi:hypothetical protein
MSNTDKTSDKIKQQMKMMHELENNLGVIGILMTHLSTSENLSTGLIEDNPTPRKE